MVALLNFKVMTMQMLKADMGFNRLGLAGCLNPKVVIMQMLEEVMSLGDAWTSRSKCLHLMDLANFLNLKVMIGQMLKVVMGWVTVWFLVSECRGAGALG